MHDQVRIEDFALEANRRQGWACYFAQRRQTEQVAYWGAEIGEHLEQLAAEHGHELHPDVVELIDLLRSAMPSGGPMTIRRYVAQRRTPPSPALQEALDG